MLGFSFFIIQLTLNTYPVYATENFCNVSPSHLLQQMHQNVSNPLSETGKKVNMRHFTLRVQINF